jgi:hypothetical protein
MDQPDRPQSTFYVFGMFCAIACFAQVCLFAFISTWVSWTRELPSAMASLWLLGGPVSLLAPISFFWGITAFARNELGRGSVASISAVLTPLLFMYGIVSATKGP